MNARLVAAGLVFLTLPPCGAHRLDEYLQGTLLSVGKSRIQAEMHLTPGVAVFPLLMAEMDTDRDGLISAAEQQAYALRVLRGVSLSLDGRRLEPAITSLRFPPPGEMEAGRGDIQLDFAANVPPGARNRTFILENRFQNRIAAYQVNCLVSRDPNIRIGMQSRNYSQSLYRLDYEETDVAAALFDFRTLVSRIVPLGLVALVLFARLCCVWRTWYSGARGRRAGAQT